MQKPLMILDGAFRCIKPPVASIKHICTDKRTGDTSAIALAVHFPTCCRGLARVGGCARDGCLHGNHWNRVVELNLFHYIRSAVAFFTMRSTRSTHDPFWLLLFFLFLALLMSTHR